jgi:inactivated superfamily I helicase
VPRPARAAFLRELARRLVDGEDAAAFYLQGMAPLFALVGGPP